MERVWVEIKIKDSSKHHMFAKPEDYDYYYRVELPGGQILESLKSYKTKGGAIRAGERVMQYIMDGRE